jgi:hypothetical protein
MPHQITIKRQVGQRRDRPVELDQRVENAAGDAVGADGDAHRHGGQHSQSPGPGRYGSGWRPGAARRWSPYSRWSPAASLFAARQTAAAGTAARSNRWRSRPTTAISSAPRVSPLIQRVLRLRLRSAGVAGLTAVAGNCFITAHADSCRCENTLLKHVFAGFDKPWVGLDRTGRLAGRVALAESPGSGARRFARGWAPAESGRWRGTPLLRCRG